MIMSRNDKASVRGRDEVKAWMEAHPQEYMQFAAKMNKQGIGGILKLGEEAFLSSPAFKQKVERMIKGERFEVSPLLEMLSQSDFAADYFREKNDERMAMAAWIKYGESPELVVKELDNLIVAQDKRKYRRMISQLFRLFWDKFFLRGNRQCKERHGYGPTSANDGSFQEILASHDEGMVRRIGDWTQRCCGGMDTAHLFIALVEVGEVNAKLLLTRFVNALQSSFPGHVIVGVRQLQKSVSYLQNLSPNRKQYGKDEVEHRFAIDAIKTEVLLAGT